MVPPSPPSRKVLVNNGMSLKSLAADLLSVSLDKSLALRCSDWEAKKLTAEQVTSPSLFSSFLLSPCQFKLTTANSSMLLRAFNSVSEHTQ